MTALVPAVNTPLDKPAGMVTSFGGIANELLLDNVTNVPPVGAALVRLTVQFTDAPPTGLRGLHTTEETAGWTTVDAVSPTEKLRKLPLREALSVALVFADTADAVAVNVVLLIPKGTTTDCGTAADAVLLANAMAVLVAAAAVRLTVHVVVPGVATLAGEQVRFESTATGTGWIVKMTERVTPDELADMVDDWTAVTAVVPAVNTPLDRPAGMVT